MLYVMRASWLLMFVIKFTIFRLLMNQITESIIMKLNVKKVPLKFIFCCGRLYDFLLGLVCIIIITVLRVICS